MKSKKIDDNQPEWGPTNKFFKQVDLSNLITFKCTHIIFFLCWFCLLIAGTSIIGYGASNFVLEQEECPAEQDFCTYDVTMDANRTILIYMKVYPFYQNNRLQQLQIYGRYLDAFSTAQLHGDNGTGYECGPYSTYDSLDKETTVGGYRVPSSSNIHPCGFPMKTIFDDAVYIVDSEGGTPDLDTATDSESQLSSNYSTEFHFKRLKAYQATQWVDVESSRFISWFTIGSTSTKYVLMGKLNMTVGDYQLIHKNSFPTQVQFNKTLILTQTNSLGVTNHLLGFCMFAYGIMVLLLHVAICCKTKQ